MIPSEAVLQFLDRQKRLLRQIYDDGWQRGVGSYTPDANPDSEPTLPLSMAAAGLTGAALLAVRRAYNYTAPTSPDAVRRALALAAAFEGVNKMGQELEALSAREAGILTSQEAADTLASWAADNAWRLAAGAAVAWAGEQAGFAEAANSDGQYLYAWTSAGDDRVCSDCETLATYPPMPLDGWPTSPGAGDTACSYGCRCGWDVWPIAQDPDAQPGLSAAQQDLANTLAAQQADTLQSMLPDAPYLQ